jgi:hypothetical protein
MWLVKGHAVSLLDVSASSPHTVRAKGDDLGGTWGRKGGGQKRLAYPVTHATAFISESHPWIFVQ